MTNPSTEFLAKSELQMCRGRTQFKHGFNSLLLDQEHGPGRMDQGRRSVTVLA